MNELLQTLTPIQAAKYLESPKLFLGLALTRRRPKTLQGGEKLVRYRPPILIRG